MGKTEPDPSASKEVDNRTPLTRNFGEKYNQFMNRVKEIDAIPFADRFKRPVRNSTIWRQFPDYQGMNSRVALLFFVLRKLPLTNPTARVLMLAIGFDYCHARASTCYVQTDEDINDLKNFYLMYEKVTTWTALRTPSFVMEHEDWHRMNKPAYRTPAGYEYNMDVLFRFLFVNFAKYHPRPVKWNGEWEQENCLVLDIYAPHNDHWFTLH